MQESPGWLGLTSRAPLNSSGRVFVHGCASQSSTGVERAGSPQPRPNRGFSGIETFSTKFRAQELRIAWCMVRAVHRLMGGISRRGNLNRATKHADLLRWFQTVHSSGA
jgi:hypothetical protein